jgi:hypothetical protein
MSNIAAPQVPNKNGSSKYAGSQTAANKPTHKMARNTASR